MKRSTGELKRRARAALEGKYGTVILGCVAVFGSNGVSGILAGNLFQGDSVGSLVMSQIFLFVLSLITGILSAGLGVLMLNIARGREYSLGDLLYFFRNHPDRVIVAGFILALIDLAVSIPYYYVGFTADVGATMEEYVAWLTETTLLLLLSIVLSLLLTLAFTMAYYLMADDLELGGMAALKESVRLMKGNKWRYLLLQISFLPLMFLSVFTLYIGMLWIIPYMEMSCAFFYLDLKGELDTPPVLPENRRHDDYNAEA